MHIGAILRHDLDTRTATRDTAVTSTRALLDEAADSRPGLVAVHAPTYAASSVCERFVLMGNQRGERVRRRRRNWGANLT